ncbi:MAG: NTPase [Candidatus Aminicenantia bacterium]
MKKNLLVTGRPGCGKTTLIRKIIELFPEKCGGFFTQEIRDKGTRKGFKIQSIQGKEAIFAHQESKSPFRVGKYGVNLNQLEEIGAQAIRQARINQKLIIIDEIGKMELFSEKFKNEVLAAFDSPQKVLATIMFRSQPFIDKIKKRKDAELISLTQENFNSVLNAIINWLKD